jgi:hypothetical protein
MLPPHPRHREPLAELVEGYGIGIGVCSETIKDGRQIGLAYRPGYGCRRGGDASPSTSQTLLFPK